MRSLVIFATPRCGSTLLARQIGASGVMAVPNEAFKPLLRARAGHADTPIADYLAHLHETGGAHGCFGVKLMRPDFAGVLRELGAASGGRLSELEALDRICPTPRRHVWIRRRDHVRQAVSWFRALHSGRWQVDAAGREFRDREPVAAEQASYAFVGIARCVVRVERQESGWQRLIERGRLAHRELWYEDLAEDPQGGVEALLRELELVDPDANLDVPAPDLQRLADDTTDDWVERFRHQSTTVVGRATLAMVRAAYATVGRG